MLDRETDALFTQEFTLHDSDCSRMGQSVPEIPDSILDASFKLDVEDTIYEPINSEHLSNAVYEAGLWERKDVTPWHQQEHTLKAANSLLFSPSNAKIISHFDLPAPAQRAEKLNVPSQEFRFGTSANYPSNLELIKTTQQTSDHIHESNEKSNSTFQSEALNASEGETSMMGTSHKSQSFSGVMEYNRYHWRVLDQLCAVQKPGKAQMPCDTNKQDSRASYDGRPLGGHWGREMKSSTTERKEEGNMRARTQVQKISKGKATSFDKKEMRALRNRESARRSRTKSKQHFQNMERSLVEMVYENKNLKVQIERLLRERAENNDCITAEDETTTNCV